MGRMRKVGRSQELQAGLDLDCVRKCANLALLLSRFCSVFMAWGEQLMYRLYACRWSFSRRNRSPSRGGRVQSLITAATRCSSSFRKIWLWLRITVRWGKISRGSRSLISGFGALASCSSGSMNTCASVCSPCTYDRSDSRISKITLVRRSCSLSANFMLARISDSESNPGDGSEEEVVGVEFKNRISNDESVRLLELEAGPDGADGWGWEEEEAEAEAGEGLRRMGSALAGRGGGGLSSGTKLGGKVPTGPRRVLPAPP